MSAAEILPSEDQICSASSAETHAMLLASRGEALAEVACEDANILEALRGAFPPPLVHTRLLAMLQMVDESLARAQIPYWITGGTLLGAVRNGGFIPHDDDIDLEIMDSDWPRAEKALRSVGRSFRSIGEWLNSGVHEGRIFFWGDDRRFTTSIDIFLRSERLEALDEFPSHEEVFPLQRMSFHNITVSAPRYAQSFLARCYGASWAEEAFVWGHCARGRMLLRCPLSAYNRAVAAAGYQAPSAAPTAAESLTLVGLACPGELREDLWSGFGWGSPWPLECEGNEKEDSNVLDLLDLKVQRFPTDADLFQALSSGGLDHLRQITGAFLDFDTSCEEGHQMLRAVGTPEELMHVHRALKENVCSQTWVDDSCYDGALPKEV